MRCSIASYPGIKKAAGAYNMTSKELIESLSLHNPIERLKPLAENGIPFFAYHGDQDKLVSLEDNSGELKKRYEALGGVMKLVVIKGRGHDLWKGFFRNREMINFIVSHAK